MRAPAMTFLVATGLLATFGAASARAQEVIGVLAVAEPPGPDGDLAAATEQLRTALAAAMPGVLAAGELRERMVGRPPPSTLAELRRAHAGAVAAYTAGEFEASVKTLRAVVEALEALPASPEAFAEWTSTMLRLARTEQELGRGVEARAVVERLLRTAPETRPDTRRYPPSFLSLFEESRERLRALGTRRLTVEAEPGTRVFVEGRDVGMTPVSLAVPPGRYRVVGDSGGVRAQPVVADLTREDCVVQLDRSVADALRPQAGPGLALAEAERPLRIVTAASRLALDRAVTASFLRDGEAVLLAATVHDVRRGRAEREGRIRLEGGVPPAGGIEALAAFLATGRASALVSTATGPTLALAPAPPRAPALDSALGARLAVPRSRAHGWAALATGAATLASGALTIYFGRAAASRYADARSMLDGSGDIRAGLSVSEYNGFIREGDNRRNLAIGASLATAVGLVATTALSVVSYRRTGEIGPFRF